MGVIDILYLEPDACGGQHNRPDVVGWIQNGTMAELFLMCDVEWGDTRQRREGFAATEIDP
jgi:hypothetical protein